MTDVTATPSRTPSSAKPVAPPDTPAAAAAPSVPPTPTVERRKYDRSIIEGNLRNAVWRLAWPTMLTNIIGGLQGIVDQAVVGNLRGFTANAAIGVSNQIFTIVVVFITSLFTGMSVLVARYVGADNHEMADRTVYQAFLTAMFISVGILAPIGYFASPMLLDFVNAAPEVKAQALPVPADHVRIQQRPVDLLHARRRAALGRRRTHADDPRRDADAAQSRPEHHSHSRASDRFRHSAQPDRRWARRSRRGCSPSIRCGSCGMAAGSCRSRDITVSDPIVRSFASIFKFGLPTGIQGIMMNVGGVLMLSFIGSLAQGAAAQAAFAVSYGQLFSLITWTSVGLLGAAAAIAGQNLGAGKPDRAEKSVHIAARYGAAGAVFIGLFFAFFPHQLLAIFGMHEPVVVEIGSELLRVLSVSGLFIAVALTYTGGLQGTGDTKSPLYISIVSQIIVPLGICFVIKHTSVLDPIDIWVAILVGHAVRCTLSILRFNQGKWRSIAINVNQHAKP